MVYYAVHAGRTQGVFFSWKDCEQQVKGYKGAVFKKFKNEEEATSFVNAGPSRKNHPSTSLNQLVNKGSGRKRHAPTLEGHNGQGQFALDNILSSAATEPYSSGFGAACSSSLFNARMDVYTDGACSKNGRKGANAGIGVYFGPDHDWNVSEPLPGKQTNICAEMEACCRAMEIAISRGVSSIRLHTDSEFTINGASKWMQGWKRNGWSLSTGAPVKNQSLWERMDSLLQELDVEWVHVRGHSGIVGNEAADGLATAGAASKRARR